jgi:acetyl esterase/lipase
MGTRGPTQSSIKLLHRQDRHFLTAIIQLLLKPFRSKLSTPRHPPDSVYESPTSISPKVEVPEVVKKLSHVAQRTVCGIHLYDITSKKLGKPATGNLIDNHKSMSHDAERQKGGKADAPRRIFYLAGGSWQIPPGPQHWRSCARLSHRLHNTVVTLVSLPLAPRAPAEKSLPVLLDLYEAVMKEAYDKDEIVTWAGDSSGANVCITLVLEGLRRGRDRGTDDPWLRPAAIMAICPSTDLTRRNPVIRDIEPSDPIMSFDSIKQSAAAWAGGMDLADPRLSPLFADLSKFKEAGVKVHGVIAGFDVLSPDAKRFKDKLAEHDVEGEWLQWDKQIHDFVLMWMYGVREGRQGWDWIEHVLSRT